MHCSARRSFLDKSPVEEQGLHHSTLAKFDRFVCPIAKESPIAFCSWSTHLQNGV